MGNSVVKRRLGAFVALVGVLALSAVALLFAFALMPSAPNQANADEKQYSFTAVDDVTIYTAYGKGDWESVICAQGLDEAVFNFNAGNNVGYWSAALANIKSVTSSDPSVAEIVSVESTLYNATVYYVKGLNKGTATITMTDVSGNTYTNVVKVEYNRIESTTNAYMHRLYNPNSGEHFYTADVDEVESVVNAGWNYELIGWMAPISSSVSNTVPVYRLYNPNENPETGSGEHHYTTSTSERDNLVSLGWKDEGIGWYSPASTLSGVKPLYRLYNPNEWNNNHHYTTSAEERDSLIDLGWKDEGIAWYGW